MHRSSPPLVPRQRAEDTRGAVARLPAGAAQELLSGCSTANSFHFRSSTNCELIYERHVTAGGVLLGVQADERPVRFRLGERDYLVKELLDRSCGPNDTFFRVRADHGNLLHLAPQ